MNKDNLLLEQAYKSIYEDVGENSKRLPFDEELYGDIFLKSFDFRVPSSYFPSDVLLKYSEEYGYGMDELESRGVFFNDIPFGCNLDIEGGSSFASYNGPRLSHGFEDDYLGGIILESWKMDSEKDEIIFTTENDIEQKRMDIAIQKYLEENIGENLNKIEKYLKQRAREEF